MAAALAVAATALAQDHESELGPVIAGVPTGRANSPHATAARSRGDGPHVHEASTRDGATRPGIKSGSADRPSELRGSRWSTSAPCQHPADELRPAEEAPISTSARPPVADRPPPLRGHPSAHVFAIVCTNEPRPRRHQRGKRYRPGRPRRQLLLWETSGEPVASPFHAFRHSRRRAARSIARCCLRLAGAACPGSLTLLLVTRQRGYLPSDDSARCP